MTQKFSLYTDLTIYENLVFVANIYSLSAKAQKHRIEDAVIDIRAQYNKASNDSRLEWWAETAARTCRFSFKQTITFILR